MAVLFHLCLCFVTVIQLTSSQSTYDDVSSCGRSDHLLSQLVTSVSQIQTAISQQNHNVTEQLIGQLVRISQQNNNVTEKMMGQLVTAVSRMETAISQLATTVSQLQSDVAELKAGNRQDVTGISGFKGKYNARLHRHLVEINVFRLLIIRLNNLYPFLPCQRLIRRSVPLSSVSRQPSQITPLETCSADVLFHR